MTASACIAATRRPEDFINRNNIVLISELRKDLRSFARAREGRGVNSSDWTRSFHRSRWAPAAFRKVEAMIEAALDGGGSLILAEMATAVGLSVIHFVRAFRPRSPQTPLAGSSYLRKQPPVRAVVNRSRISSRQSAFALFCLVRPPSRSCPPCSYRFALKASRHSFPLAASD